MDKHEIPHDNCCSLACQRESSTIIHFSSPPPHTCMLMQLLACSWTTLHFSLFSLGLWRCRKTPGGQTGAIQREQSSKHPLVCLSILHPSHVQQKTAGGGLQTQLVKKYLHLRSRCCLITSAPLIVLFLNYCCCPNCVKCHSCFQG